MVAEIVLFEDVTCRGSHRHVFFEEANLKTSQDFNDKVSSFVIVSGNWTFWRDVNFTGPKSNTFGPGKYNWVENVGIPNDSVSSLSSIRH